MTAQYEQSQHLFHFDNKNFNQNFINTSHKAYKSKVLLPILNLLRDRSNESSIKALFEQLVLMKIMEDTHKIILHYSPTRPKE